MTDRIDSTPAVVYVIAQLAGLVVAVGVMVVEQRLGSLVQSRSNHRPICDEHDYRSLQRREPALWQYVWIYIVGPCVGAVIGASFYDYAALGPHEAD